jgi:hypothetical protein
VFGPQLFGGGGGSGIAPGPDVNFPGLAGGQGGQGLDPAVDPQADLFEFIESVTEDVQASWEEQFRAAGQDYPETQLVVFEEGTQTGCGPGSAATGPFYCPADSLVYLDLGFFQELSDRFGAPGDTAIAYVVAHEFGHHVQNVLGISDDVRSAQQSDPDRANELSVRLELQADCLAGVWAYSVYERELLDPGDVEEALAAAAAVGDDRLQSQAGGGVNPETWTHGSSEQRTAWFNRGFETGDFNSCDTFRADI